MLGIRHNMITLLYAAKGHLENYFHFRDEAGFKTCEDRLASAEKTLHRVHDLVKRTLDITRNIGRRINTAPKPQNNSRANLRDTWAIISKQLCEETQGSPVQIKASLPYAFPELCCDAQDLEEALSLLVQNSIDAFRSADAAANAAVAYPNKHLVLRAEIGLSHSEAKAVITVADNGPGIPQESISQMFQPFFSTRLEQGGNGLGLYLANQLISKNNGTIRVSSFEGCGCTFVIELPLAAPAAQPSERVA